MTPQWLIRLREFLRDSPKNRKYIGETSDKAAAAAEKASDAIEGGFEVLGGCLMAILFFGVIVFVGGAVVIWVYKFASSQWSSI